VAGQHHRDFFYETLREIASRCSKSMLYLDNHSVFH
jgi:hypothetical protein